MMPSTNRSHLTGCIFGLLLASVRGFSSIQPTTSAFPLWSSASATAGKGFGAVEEKTTNTKTAGKPTDNRPINEIKAELLDLLPSMTGTEEEFRKVEDMVNALEEKYVPAQTLGFLNLAMSGEWQLLFSTNLTGSGNPAKFRLRELFQKIETNNLEGTISNQALWDLAEEHDGVFDASGTFTVKCSYSINQGARMVVDLDDHLLNLSKGSKVPEDVQGLVGRLHKAMPKEMFDPQNHAMDTTYLDTDLRIVRMTGPRLEGVRDIFIRRGSLEIDPTKD